MTISVARANSANVDREHRLVKVDPADVWDVLPGRSSHCSAPRVRTIEASYRKVDHLANEVPAGRSHAQAAVETRGDSRAATIMGALLGIALLVGSAFGGVFSGEEYSYVPNEDHSSVVSANVR